MEAKAGFISGNTTINPELRHGLGITWAIGLLTWAIGLQNCMDELFVKCRTPINFPFWWGRSEVTFFLCARNRWSKLQHSTTLYVGPDCFVVRDVFLSRHWEIHRGRQNGPIQHKIADQQPLEDNDRDCKRPTVCRLESLHKNKT